jgi:hypothetical protein
MSFYGTTLGIGRFREIYQLQHIDFAQEKICSAINIWKNGANIAKMG